MRSPKLRDNKYCKRFEPYPLNEIPDNIVIKICGHFIDRLHIGRKDLSGSDWGEAFAEAICGEHLDRPIGIADVVHEQMAWSMKTVKHPDPLKAKSVRLISGRCSPDFSYGITDPHKDTQETGRAVLGIWNERTNIAQDSYNPLRTAFLIRSNDLASYCLFEEESHRYRTSDYVWQVNANGNIVGKNIETGRICFTWQPHGSQFTIHTEVPENAKRFQIRIPKPLDKEKLLKDIGFDTSWVNIIN